MGKSRNQTVTQRPDPQTEGMMSQVYGAALSAANGGAQPVPGVDPATQQAMQQYRQMGQLGSMGMSAMGGDQNAFQNFMNPYQQQVLDAVSRQYGDMRGQITAGVNDQATQARAFGGSRHGIALAQQMRDVNQGQMNQMAGLNYQGFNDAMGRAGQLANMGMGASGQMAQLGEYQRQVQMAQDPAMRRLQILQGAMQGMPHGSSVTQPVNRNHAAGALGGAAAGASIAGPWGAAAGGLLGLLGG